MLKLVTNSRSTNLNSSETSQAANLQRTKNENNQETNSPKDISTNMTTNNSNDQKQTDSEKIITVKTECQDDNRLSLLVKAAERIVNEENRSNETQKPDNHQKHLRTNHNQHIVSQAYSDTNFITFNEFVNTPNTRSNEISNLNQSSNVPIFIGKNGKPTRPFKAYPKESLATSIDTVSFSSSSCSSSGEHSSRLQSPPLSASSPIPFSVSNEQTDLKSCNNQNLVREIRDYSPQLCPQNTTQNQQQLSILQLLSQQIQQQQMSAKSNASQPQMVINLEDILNVVLNAASLVNNSKQPSNNTITRASPSIHDTPTPNTLSPITHQEHSHGPIDNIISQDSVNTYTHLESPDVDSFSSIDDLTKMSLMSSNDFCSQYKKRIQQAKERLLQKKIQEEQEMARQKELKQSKKSRKRSQSTVAQSEHGSIEESQKKKFNNGNQAANGSDLNLLMEDKKNSDLIKMFILNGLNNSQGLNEKQQSKIQLVLSALSINEELQQTNALTSYQEEPLPTDESINNSYPLKKRHRMHQQAQQQQEQQKQQQQDQSSKSIMDQSASDRIQHSQQNEIIQNQQTNHGNIHYCQQVKDENLLKFANVTETNDQQDPQKHQQHLSRNPTSNIAKSDMTVNIQVNGSSICSSSNSMSASPSPQSSPSIFMDSISSTSSSGVNLVNNLSINQAYSSSQPSHQRKSRDLSNSSNSSSRSSSTNNRHSTNRSRGPTHMPSAKVVARKTSIDIDQMSEGPEKDEAYKERRRKNNEAAKRSRDARRAKEDDIALRAAILERENLQLKVEVSQLKQETNKLRCLLYNS